MRKSALMIYLLSFAGTAIAAGKASDQSPANNPQDHPTQVETGLRLLAEGRLDAGRAALQEVLRNDSETADQARWALGQVYAGDKWLPYLEVVNQQGRWPEVFKYQKERQKYGDSFREQLFLADGCRAHGLVDEERAHLNRTVILDRSFSEGYERLGYRKLNGSWVAPDEVLLDLIKYQRDARNLEAWRSWAVKLHERFVKAGGRPNATVWEEELNRVRTPDAIPALEQCFAGLSESEMAAYMRWLNAIDSVEASAALAKLTVYGPSPEFRVQAQHYLRNRRVEEFAPYLLGQLEISQEFVTAMPVTVRLAGINVPAVRYTNKTTRKDAQHDISVDQNLYLVLPTRGVSIGPDGSLSVTRRHFTGPAIGSIDVDPQQNQFRWEQFLARSNVMRFMTNQSMLHSTIADEVRTQRAQRALENATQIEENQSDRNWWDWWLTHNDTVFSSGLQRVAQNNYDEVWYVDQRGTTPVRRVIPQNVTTRLSSCFAPGTLVETEHGQRKIDDVQVGDRVLSQDVETGELQFKPVFDITTREKANLVKLKTSSEEITCSIGHPFWVVGRGWRMAKELEPGMKLHTLDGAQFDVQSIEEVGSGTVFNLIVADFGTYFAGASRFYTHDVTPRKATDMVIPGLRKEFH